MGCAEPPPPPHYIFFFLRQCQQAEEDEETMYDGVAELWFDKEEDLFAAYDTEAGKAVATDSLAVVSKRDRLLTTEYVD